MHKHSSSLGLYLCPISFIGLSKTHTHPLAPISLVCSSIIIILLLINHCDREGATLHLSTGTHPFPASLSPFYHRALICAHSLSLPLGSTHSSSSAGEHQQRSCLVPPGVFFFLISPPNWHVPQQGRVRPRSNSRPLVNLLTTAACTSGDTHLQPSSLCRYKKKQMERKEQAKRR